MLQTLQFERRFRLCTKLWLVYCCMGKKNQVDGQLKTNSELPEFPFLSGAKKRNVTGHV